MKRHLFSLVAAVCMSLVAVAAAAASADARTIAANATVAARLPPVIEFTVPAAGPVSVILTDLQNQIAFTSLTAVVTRGAIKVATLTAPGTQQFQAVAGSYKVQVIGRVPSAYGLFRVEVRTPDQLLSLTTDQIASGVPVSAGQTPLRYTLQPGTYEVALRDAAFPAALQFADLAVFRVGGNGVPVFQPLVKSSPADCVAAACTGSFTIAVAGDYDVAVAAAATPSDGRGLYTVSLTGPAGAVVSAEAYAVGDLPEPVAVTLPVTGDYSLSLTDLLAPGSPLSELRVLLVQRANVLGGRSGEGQVTAAGAATGAAKLFVLSAPGAGGVGAFNLQLRRSSGQLVYEAAGTAPEGLVTAQTAAGYRYAVTVPASGDYRLVLRDLQFPAAFTTLRAMVIQGGAVHSLGASGSLAAPLAAGSAFVLVTGTKGATTDSLFGVALEPAAAGSAALLSKTQGVGGLFDTRPVLVTVAGAYDLAISDLQFPVALGELIVAVTRGTELVGQTFGSAGLTFAAQPGEYAINLLARPAAGAEYGTWGFALTSTPPPTITFAATPVTVAAQGTATLNWSTTGATGCTASGGWSGARASAGTATSAALAATTVFTITCIGAGGSATASATVEVSPPPGGGGSAGGGGAVDPLLLVLLGLLALRILPVIRQTGSEAPDRHP